MSSIFSVEYELSLFIALRGEYVKFLFSLFQKGRSKIVKRTEYVAYNHTDMKTLYINIMQAICLHKSIIWFDIFVFIKKSNCKGILFRDFLTQTLIGLGN